MWGLVMLSLTSLKIELFLASFLSDEVPNSHEIKMDDVWCCTEPPMFDWVPITSPNLDYAKAEFATPIPPGTTKDGPFAFNDDSLSAYGRFAQLLTIFASYRRS